MECEVEEYEENEFLKFPSIIGYIATGEETLWDIAKRYHTDEDAIRAANQLENDEDAAKYMLLIPRIRQSSSSRGSLLATSRSRE